MALLVAYVRAIAASVGAGQIIIGPMAKPHRMFAVTVGCLGMMILDLMQVTLPLMIWTISIINAGIAITIWRRVRHLAKVLHQTPS